MGGAVDEATRYDRQVRLWGKSTQERLQRAKVVALHPRGGVLCEVLKNLALAGVGSIAVCEAAGREALVSAADCCATHLMRAEDVGKVPRAAALAGRLARINSHVAVGVAAAAAPGPATVCLSRCTTLGAMRKAVAAWHARAKCVVLLFEAGDLTLALFVSAPTDGSPGTPPLDQLHQLTSSPAAVARLPRPFQLGLLMLHLNSHMLDRAAAGESTRFAALLGVALDTCRALNLRALSHDDVQRALNILCGQAGLSPDPTAVAATFSGGVVAQQIISHISHSPASGVNPYDWVVATAAPVMECVVGTREP